jgi:hypothetical protein
VPKAFALHFFGPFQNSNGHTILKLYPASYRKQMSLDRAIWNVTIET